ncbi:uncharacterized protein BCR38DRAFT_443917, partial [Pseudomassariella vexata]
MNSHQTSRTILWALIRRCCFLAMLYDSGRGQTRVRAHYQPVSTPSLHPSVTTLLCIMFKTYSVPLKIESYIDGLVLPWIETNLLPPQWSRTTGNSSILDLGINDRHRVRYLDRKTMDQPGHLPRAWLIEISRTDVLHRRPLVERTRCPVLGGRLNTSIGC